MPFNLVLGATRSGKTRLVEAWAQTVAPYQLMVATCYASNREMAARIAIHQKSRASSWQLVEEPLEPVQAIGLFRKAHPDFQGCIVLDSLGMWINNLMGQNMPAPVIMRRCKELAQFFCNLDLPCAIISEDIGSLPAAAASRKYGDILGTANQLLARLAQNAALVVAGLPVLLKGVSFFSSNPG